MSLQLSCSATCQIWIWYHTSDSDGLVQERRNSIANALELRLSCTNPSIYFSNAKMVPTEELMNRAKVSPTPVGCSMFIGMLLWYKAGMGQSNLLTYKCNSFIASSQPTERGASPSPINPLCAGLMWENCKIYLYFLSFVGMEMVLNSWNPSKWNLYILPCSVQYLLMTWQHKVPWLISLQNISASSPDGLLTGMPSDVIRCLSALWLQMPWC